MTYSISETKAQVNITDPNTNRTVNAVILMNRVEGLRAHNDELIAEIEHLKSQLSKGEI